jgi:hypothetical protein
VSDLRRIDRGMGMRCLVLMCFLSLLLSYAETAILAADLNLRRNHAVVSKSTLLSTTASSTSL